MDVGVGMQTGERVVGCVDCGTYEGADNDILVTFDAD
jgi:hypothetical protein